MHQYPDGLNTDAIIVKLALNEDTQEVPDVFATYGIGRLD
jgi:hypothetical protein